MTFGVTPDFNGSGRRGLSASLAPPPPPASLQFPHCSLVSPAVASSSHFPGLGSSSSPLPPPARPPPHQLTSVRRLSIFAEIRFDSRLRFLLLRTPRSTHYTMHRPKSALPPASPSRKGGALHLLSPSRRAPPRSPSAPSCRLNCYSDFFPVGGSRSAVRGPSAELDLCTGLLTKLEAKNHSGTQARFARTARVVVGALKTDGGTESSFTLLRRSLARKLPPLP